MVRSHLVSGLGRRLLVAFTAIGSVLGPGACFTGRPGKPAQAPVRLAIGYAGPGQNDTVGLRILATLVISDRLVRLGRDGRIEPSLAERWEQSVDGLTWRFILREALTFHDGSPLVASVVADRLKAYCAATPLSVDCRDIISIETDGPRAVVIRLRAPSSLLLDSISAVAIYRDPSRRIGAGPFRQTPDGKGYVYEAFPAYHRGRPTIDRIELKLFPSPRNAWTALMRGEIDMVYEVSPDAVEFIEQSSSAQVRSFLRNYAYTMVLNARRPGLAKRDIRRALNVAVNRTELISRVFRGRGYAATDPVWPRHWAYKHDLPRLRFNPAEAIRLLEGQGLTMSHGPNPEIPSRFRFTCLIPDYDPRFEPLGLQLQRQFMEVGIDMQMQSVSDRALGTRALAGDFDALLVDLNATNGLYWIYQLWHSPEKRAPPFFLNHGYAAADGALDRILRSRTEEEMRGAVEALQRVMRDDPPAVFLLWTETARAISARFRLPLTPDRDVFSTMRLWQPVSAP